MKTATPALQALLTSGTVFWMTDLYEITLIDGSIVRYAGGGKTLYYDNYNWDALGPLFKRDSTRLTRGLETDTLGLTVTAGTEHLLLGQPWMITLANGGLDGARLILRRAFAPTPADAIVGDVELFSGRVGEVECNQLEGKIRINSDLELLDTEVPGSVIQASCSRKLYSPGCTVPRAAWQIAGNAAAGSTQAKLQTVLTQDADYFTGGEVRITSGLNAGARRTIKKHTADGAMALAYPLGHPIGAGDAFVIWPGCDHTLGDNGCPKFGGAHMLRFGGQPYVPAPETVL